MKRRLSIAMALIGDSKVIILGRLKIFVNLKLLDVTLKMSQQVDWIHLIGVVFGNLFVNTKINAP